MRSRSLPVVSVLTALALAGCGSGETDTAATASGSASPSATSSTSASTTLTPSTTTSAAPSTPAGRTLEITIKGKQVTPAPGLVELASGETLTLVVTSDHDDELHAHGFEVEEALKAGVPTTVTITGGEPGVYELETHEPELRLAQIAVR